MRYNEEMSLHYPVWRKHIKLDIRKRKRDRERDREKRIHHYIFLEIENLETTNSL